MVTIKIIGDDDGVNDDGDTIRTEMMMVMIMMIIMVVVVVTMIKMMRMIAMMVWRL